MKLTTLKPSIQSLRSGLAKLNTGADGRRAGTFADSRRGSRHERGYGAAWDKLRVVILQRDQYLCRACRAAGRLQPANQVDHIVSKVAARAMGWSEAEIEHPDNLQSLCKPCHTRKTQVEKAKGGGAGQLLPEWLPRPTVPVVVVCGRPGSGKTTYVQDRAQQDDMVLDMDMLAAEVSGKPMYHHNSEDLRVAIRLRNARLAALSNGGYRAAWLVVTADSELERQWWVQKLGATLHVIDTPVAECIARIEADTRRPPDVRLRHIAAAMAWR